MIFKRLSFHLDSVNIAGLPSLSRFSNLVIYIRLNVDGSQIVN